jgi:hypothetical protein
MREVTFGTVSAPSRVGNLWLGTTIQLAPLHTLAVSFSGTAEAENLGLESGFDLPARSYRRTALPQGAGDADLGGSARTSLAG